MWMDNETGIDFLNFGSIAKTVAEIIEQANNRPISIGVSGAWGVGKSSMIKLIESELRQKGQSDSQGSSQSSKGHNRYLFVEFNAWLYQGYDDARAALIEVVASELAKEAQSRETVLEKSATLLKRVRWFRTAKLVATVGAPLAFGLPPVGLVGDGWDLLKKAIGGTVDQESLDKVDGAIGKAAETSKGLLKPKEETSPPKEIEDLRKNFEEVLDELGVTLVVLIDDLDRCLPETTISTLEAIRLLLFLKNTAFVIAADDQMIKHAVKKHFQGVDDDLVINYFDKLIQVPIRVPPLGTQEVRAYIMLLFIENSGLKEHEIEHLRVSMCNQLGKTWQGHRVDLKFVKDLNKSLPSDLIARLHAADQLASIMTSSSGIAGNPRLIKRFLNALSIRMAMSKAQGVGVNETELVKVLLFERCGNPKAYAELIKAVTESQDGKPTKLTPWESAVRKGENLVLDAPWDDPFVIEWLRLEPTLGDKDLRGAIYLSREHVPLITAEDRLSNEATEVLEALLTHPEMANSIKDQIKALPNKAEVSVIMEKLLTIAGKEQEWGTPGILEALIVIGEQDHSQGQRLANFLMDRPGQQIKPNIVPKISGYGWSKDVFEAWSEEDTVSAPVKKAIQTRGTNGNVAIK